MVTLEFEYKNPHVEKNGGYRIFPKKQENLNIYQAAYEIEKNVAEYIL